MARKPDGLADGPRRRAPSTCPTIFAGVDNSAKIAQEEIFGPVLCVIPFDTDDEAVAIANDSIYGLGGGVQSTNLERAREVAAAHAHRHRVGQRLPHDHARRGPSVATSSRASAVSSAIQGYNAYRQVKHVHINPGTTRDGYMHFVGLSDKI